MSRAMRIGTLSLLSLALMLGGCTFVKLTPGGERVRILDAQDVTQCERVGNTSATVAEQVGIFKRPPEKLAQEVDHAARNAAAEMGGDTLVPRGPLREGRRGYDVYRCIR
ncbi:DUF4156 domain-containing protein [Ectothiorhodospira lacustris]|uniref:DUF4156 domain-containing protein n=1 Tax=Ectothiorhodospira lacustris TaxID=2899127 RepID=UPI001EE7EC7E|nr:DUF4156 domain-containing protein [Ectothiorhodospira lacustris]MCG5508859.1 DUF4156 domain-containing protein [Ectothiorhodospira lacustris]MCG5520650.1 DUF4156 domain-containing protein [Ectothiorhodospira lacustris]